MSLATCGRDTLWYWMRERHRIYERRHAGQPKPWTDDPILQSYKFVNVFRRLDTGTKWLLDNFLIPHQLEAESLLVHNICWYRCFNWYETGAAIGWNTDWLRGEIYNKLKDRAKVFTGAYIIHSELGMSKLLSMIDVAGELFNHRHDISGVARESRSLEATFNYLQLHKHIGPFMAYQMVLDMMYTKVLRDADDRYGWACVGPGAKRGLMRLQMPYGYRTGVKSMLELTQEARTALGNFPPVDIHDIEFSLCELDKYMRVKAGEGKPRSKYEGKP